MDIINGKFFIIDGITYNSISDISSAINELKKEITRLKSSEGIQSEIDIIVEQYGLQNVLEALINNVTKTISYVKGCKVKDITYMVKVFSGLEKVLTDYKNRYEEE